VPRLVPEQVAVGRKRVSSGDDDAAQGESRCGRHRQPVPGADHQAVTSPGQPGAARERDAKAGQRGAVGQVDRAPQPVPRAHRQVCPSGGP
jgi:hypothetical protein